jgi:hypothetical protein
MHMQDITDMAKVAAQCVGYRPQQMTTSELRALAEMRRRSSDRTNELAIVSCPTVQDIDKPGTKAAVKGLRMASHAMAAVIERHTGDATTAAISFNDAKMVVHAYLLAYLTEARASAKSQPEGVR